MDSVIRGRIKILDNSFLSMAAFDQEIEEATKARSADNKFFLRIAKGVAWKKL